MIKTCHNSSSRQRLCMPGAISHEPPRLDASTASTIAVFQHQYLFGFPPPYRDPVYAVCHRSLKPTCVHDTLWRNRDAYSLEPQIYQLFPLVFPSFNNTLLASEMRNHRMGDGVRALPTTLSENVVRSRRRRRRWAEPPRTLYFPSASGITLPYFQIMVISWCPPISQM